MSSMMTETPVDALAPPRPFDLTTIESLILSAEHAVIIADDLAQWALDARDDSDSASRWRAVAETRRMANDRWQTAARQMRPHVD